MSSKLFRRERRPVAGSAERAKESSDAALGFQDDANCVCYLDECEKRRRRQNWLAIESVLEVAIAFALVALCFAAYGCLAAHNHLR